MTNGSSTDLRADCRNCHALCCVAPAFSASADFAVDKPAGQPCPKLRLDFRCGIHDVLRQNGFPGCVVYDCFGAGQQVSQLTFGGRDWRANPELAGPMFTVLPIMRQLHEMLWYLAEARALPASHQVRDQLDTVNALITDLTHGDPHSLIALDVAAHRLAVSRLLTVISDRARADLLGTGRRRRALDRSGADLFGAQLNRADLRGACLRGSRLIGADLRAADLRGADLLGADLRGADLRGANLSGAIFLIPAQLESAIGDPNTVVPAALNHPAHWLAREPPGAT